MIRETLHVKLFISALIAASVLTAGAASAYPHHRQRVCTMRHHHRVCTWR
jgi:hypothetical protein